VSYHLPLLVTIMLAGSPSRADADDYRLAVGITDVASAAAFTVGIKLDLDCKPCLATAVVGFVGMALGAPIIHASEDNLGRMGIILGARVVLPTIGLAAAARIGVSDNVLLGGFLLGFLAATAIDVAMAADDDATTGARIISIGAQF